jgi:hypothetical protein
MSLATERQTGQLICTCRHPTRRCVVLFDAIHLTDVYECAHCGRLIAACPTRPRSETR